MSTISIWVPFNFLIEKYKGLVQYDIYAKKFTEELQQLADILKQDDCPYEVDDKFIKMLENYMSDNLIT
jgi:hypothetical protein